MTIGAKNYLILGLLLSPAVFLVLFAFPWRIKPEPIPFSTFASSSGITLPPVRNFEAYSVQAKDQILYAKFEATPEAVSEFIKANSLITSTDELGYEFALISITNLSTAYWGGSRRPVAGWWDGDFIPEATCTGNDHRWVIGRRTTNASTYLVFIEAFPANP